ncbi:SURF1 family cytochrome oxidase biogenesis protein [Sphingomonas sp. KR1UV-12]|uniref:SURF1-like protein n=1 Tax=Sphingomonas aurea TaxID=3063994 RepID=A0ABT9EP00_9SPHN|nr:SURF1 family cytochrome oxidase biogenesis protein [Sphingomonas sp. KR1UV-12]MDP1028531.1 SURF1 family cytochrome oxidase biogenesis protein [Sphingomonas sp. KR1UV-12]
MRRLPLIPTLIVALAVAAMIALGLWQLTDRLPKKEAFLAQLADNPARPPVPFPTTPDDRLLFRRSAADCAPPVAVKLAGAGAAGFRSIATCAGGTIVQLGTTRDPKAQVRWSGGPVTGYIGHAPDGRSLIGSLLDHRPPLPMLVAMPPAAGLSANAPPDIGAVPNNHLAYAGQWFFFAAIATIVYVLAVRRRER